jgi:hypothetical protein
MTTKRKRMIDRLRAEWPEVQWSYDPYMRQWNASDGSYVTRVAFLAPRYDGDDDSFTTRIFRYFKDGRSPIELHGWRDWLLLGDERR